MRYFEKFDSLTDFQRAIDSRSINPVFKDLPLSSQTGTKSFTSTESYEEASKLMICGDASNLDKIKSANISGLKSNDKSFAMQIERAVCGCTPNVPAYINGIPTSMLNFRKIQKSTKIINIAVSGSVSFDIEASDVINASASIASIISSIERKGFRVNLYVSFGASEQRDNIGVLIRIKKSSSPLNMLNIAYPLINPSMLRRHFFRYIETYPNKISSDFLWGYGRPSDCNDEIKKAIPDIHILTLRELLNTDTQDICNTLIKSM